MIPLCLLPLSSHQRCLPLLDLHLLPYYIDSFERLPSSLELNCQSTFPVNFTSISLLKHYYCYTYPTSPTPRKTPVISTNLLLSRIPIAMSYESKPPRTSSSSTRIGSSSSHSSSSRDPLRDYRMGEYTRRSDSTQRFFVSGDSTRSATSMNDQMRQWDNKWASASRADASRRR